MEGWLRLVAGLLLALAPAPQGPPDAAIRVMSFNVRLGVADDGEDSWIHRRDLLVETVRRFDPDLLGTQETYPFQAQYLLEQLDGYAYVGWPRQPGSADGEECGILYRAARFERQDAGQLWLSETPDVPGSKSWDAAFPHIVTWVALRDRAHLGAALTLFNTHFDHLGTTARLESARLLRARLASLPPGATWIVTGDFNTPEASPPYEALVGAGADGLRVVDAHRTVHPRPAADEGTFHAFKGQTAGARIDWILHSPTLAALAADIDRTQRNGRYPSDHFPVTATLR
jgi:endonuclease/exonuclease/phosphatase family metal-dependent hydrolase